MVNVFDIPAPVSKGTRATSMRTNLKVIRMVASLSILSYLRSTVRFMLVPPTDDKRDQRNDQEHIQPQWNNPPLRLKEVPVGDGDGYGKQSDGQRNQEKVLRNERDGPLGQRDENP